MASLVGHSGQVVSVEPTAWAYGKLCRNISLNPHLSTRLRPIAAALVSDKQSQPQSFFASWSLTAQEQSHSVHGGSARSTEGSRFLTLDELSQELDLQRLDLIKLDVDGYEYDVLAGGVKTLTKFRPPIVMELCTYVHTERGRDLRLVIEQLTALGYSLYDEKALRPLPGDFAELVRRIPVGGCINAVAMVRC